MVQSSDIRQKYEQRARERKEAHEQNASLVNSLNKRFDFESGDRDLNDILKSNKKLLQQATGVSVETSTTLAQDREKLERIDKDLDQMHGNLDKSEKALNKFNKFGQVIKSFFIKKKSSKGKNNSESNSSESGPKDQVYDLMNFSNKLEADKLTDEERIADLQRNLEDLKIVVGQTGQEIGEQNEILEKIAEKTASADEKITKQDEKLRNIR